MKAIILAGGFGTRISEETQIIPKPMIEIGNRPIIWHIMKIYANYGINEFIICCGYKGYKIKEYFANYSIHTSDVTFDLANNSIEFHRKYAEPWRVTLVDTGENSMTGGRLKRVKEYINNETFMFTYGDGLSDINLSNLLNQHRKEKRLATVTTIQPPGRYGSIQFGVDNQVARIKEKPKGEGGWINGGFYVLEPEVLDRIESDKTIWEKEPLETLASDNQLTAYAHKGFWHPLDTLRDKRLLEDLWQTGQAPWKCW